MSQQNAFFKPTTKYNEFLLLELLHSDPKLTQRKLCEELSLSIASINDYLKNMVLEGYLEKERLSYKTVHYNLTKKGVRRKNYLKISYFNSIQEMYRSSKEDVLNFLKEIVGEKPCKLVLYGAGEVAELFLQVLNNDENPIQIVAVVDDDVQLQNKKVQGYTIHPLSDIKSLKHDGVLIGSFTHNNTMYEHLMKIDYKPDKIFQFFEE